MPDIPVLVLTSSRSVIIASIELECMNFLFYVTFTTLNTKAQMSDTMNLGKFLSAQHFWPSVSTFFPYNLSFSEVYDQYSLGHNPNKEICHESNVIVCEH